MSAEPKTVDQVLADCKSPEGSPIVLNGQSWVLPAKLRGYQIKKVVPLMHGITAATLDNAKVIMFGGKPLPLPNITEEAITQMVQAHYWALRDNYPTLTLDHFEMMTWTVDELSDNMQAIGRAAGMKMIKKDGEPAKDVPPGEGGAPASQTGTNTSST